MEFAETNQIGGRYEMKRISMMFIVALGLLIPSAAFVGTAQAGNPHGVKGDPNGSCSTNRPCDNTNLPQSKGCNDSSSAHNPHCGTATTTPTTTATAPAPGTPVSTQKPNVKSQNAGGGNAGTAAAELPFTGVNAAVLALLGALLVGTGLGLRRRVAAPETKVSL
jgi:hypothetical protein